ncbi:MAG: AraC family transcriptional regulator [Ruminococcus sp.]|nr:AraC family transcriptional regulator [Ruminococcus sp.]
MNDRLKAVQRMQRYIESHLGEVITPADLAAVSYFSPWYARRLFEEYTGLTPARYIRRLKLSRSALRLRDERCTVLDTALDMGFGSAEGYQRAFRTEFGINPRAYAEAPVPIPLFTPSLVESDESERNDSMENVKTIFVTEVKKPARKVIIKRGIKADEYRSYCEEVGCDVWGILVSIKSIGGEPVCMWLPEHLRKPKANIYVQGAEVPEDYSGPVPDGFEVIDLPAGDFLMFRGEPFDEENYVSAIQQVWQAEEKFDLSASGYMPDDRNPRIQLEPVGTRGYIELVPVKNL